MKPSYSLRKLFNDVHLWLGIGSGLVLFVICLTGTIYALHTEIDHLLSPGKYYVQAAPHAQPLPIDSLLPQLETKLKGTVSAVTIPADPTMSYQVSLLPEKKRMTTSPEGGQAKRGGKAAKDKKPRAKVYFVNPYTGAVSGEQRKGADKFFRDVEDIHRYLFMGNTAGKLVSGIAAIIFVCITITGLVIWTPKKIKNIKQGLTIKLDARGKRLNYDLHKTLGFYASFLILVMGLTGLCWSFDWYKNGMSTVLGAKVFKTKGEKPIPSAYKDRAAKMLPFSTLIARAHNELPYNGDTKINLPDEPGNAVTVLKNKTGFLVVAGADRVLLDPFDGSVLKKEPFSSKPFGAKIADSIRLIHTGEIFGTFSKIIYFLAALIGTSLPVTGTIIWINKLKKKGKKKTTVVRKPVADAVA